MGVGILRDYLRLIREIMVLSVFRHVYMCVITLVVVLLTFASTYYLVKASSYLGLVSKTFKTAEFAPSLKLFVHTSVVALCLKFIPMHIYTWVLQTIMRHEFIALLKRYINMSYTKFHSKTPGKLRYLIFLKALCTPMCSQTIIFEFTKMSGNTIFSFIQIKKDINFFSALIFIIIPAVYLSATFYFIYKRLEYQQRYLVEQEKISSILYDKLINYDVIKTFNLEDSESASFYSNLQDQTNAHINMGNFTARGEYLLSYVLYIPNIIVLWTCLASSSISNDKFFSITILYVLMSDQLETLGKQLIILVNYLVQVKFTEIDDVPAAEDQTAKADLGSFTSSIRFAGVTLYHGEKAVVRDINAVIPKGQKIAVVGPNGTGKSTFVKALLGFTKFTGDIFFDDMNTKQLNWKSILGQISYVPQEDYTSDDTVMNNLRLGDKNASDQFIIEKAKLFSAHDTFVDLNRSYETEAGPRGNNLSGGQLQKISLVRAVVKDSPIFILDEATAAMDKGFENSLIQKLFRNLEDRTIIMIVHGKDYLSRFDQLFFLNDGMLEQTGTYDELLRTNTNFQKFAI